MKYFHILGFLIGFSCFSIWAQSLEIVLPWTAPISVSFGELTYLAPTLSGEAATDGIPRFLYRKELKSVDFSSELISYNAINATAAEVNYLAAIGFDLPTSLNYSLKVVRAANLPMLSFSCYPFYIEQETVKKLTSVSVNLTKQSPSAINKDFVANSVLEQGEWYKISVSSDGIHKIDRSLLGALGINVNGLNPNHIHVFGNGEGSLPELNATPYTDDLAQNAISIVGGQDGSFDEGDYILFYGHGPHQWYPNGTVEFEQRRNPYSDKSFYFIQISSSLPAKIINEIDYS